MMYHTSLLPKEARFPQQAHYSFELAEAPFAHLPTRNLTA